MSSTNSILTVGLMEGSVSMRLLAYRNHLSQQSYRKLSLIKPIFKERREKQKKILKLEGVRGRKKDNRALISSHFCPRADERRRVNYLQIASHQCYAEWAGWPGLWQQRSLVHPHSNSHTTCGHMQLCRRCKGKARPICQLELQQFSWQGLGLLGRLNTAVGEKWPWWKVAFFCFSTRLGHC